MTPEEKDALNRRLAKYLGWRWVKCSQGGGVAFPASFESLENLARLAPAVSWEAWEGTEEEAYADALKAGGDPYWDVPRYCTCFSASAALKAHMREKGHEYRTGWDKKRGAWAEVDSLYPWTEQRFFPAWGDTEEIALVVAFLAAHDAEQEAKK